MIALLLTLALVGLLWAEDLRADRARLRAAPDLTGRLSEVYQRPAALRRR